jgi:hypothetical protein
LRQWKVEDLLFVAVHLLFFETFHLHRKKFDLLGTKNVWPQGCAMAMKKQWEAKRQQKPLTRPKTFYDTCTLRTLSAI